MAKTAIAKMDPKKVKAAFFSWPGGRQSGMQLKKSAMGSVKMNTNFAWNGTSLLLRSLNPSLVPSHIDCVWSATSSPAAFCWVQKSEFWYHFSKAAKVTFAVMSPGAIKIDWRGTEAKKDTQGKTQKKCTQVFSNHKHTVHDGN